jgi:hypothetical protein
LANGGEVNFNKTGVNGLQWQDKKKKKGAWDFQAPVEGSQ